MTGDIMTDHVGKRVLLTRRYAGYDLFEATVLEFVTEGDEAYVKLRHTNGSESWQKADDYELVAVLPGPWASR